MISTRNELLIYAAKTIKNMYQEYAEKESKNTLCTVVDQNSYIVSKAEELLRPCWGLSGLYANNIYISINVNGNEIEINEFIKSSLLNIISQNIPYSLDPTNFACEPHMTKVTCFLSRLQMQLVSLEDTRYLTINKTNPQQLPNQATTADKLINVARVLKVRVLNSGTFA